MCIWGGTIQRIKEMTRMEITKGFVGIRGMPQSSLELLWDIFIVIY